MTKLNHNYQSGFGNHFQSEALVGALPKGQNSPQKPPMGLYAEQLSGSAFTMNRGQNLHSWLYRILPSVVHKDFKPTPHPGLLQNETPEAIPNQLRWNPQEEPKTPVDFIMSWQALLSSGSSHQHDGGCIYLFSANKSMENSFFYNSDAELLILPYKGCLEFRTEMGRLTVSPGEVACIPRGIKWSAHLSELCAGYVLENYGQAFTLPHLGLIGANGLANPRDFLVPNAHYEDTNGAYTLLNKFGQKLWAAQLTHSPLNVVAWHGNYAPYKYNLKQFNTINTVSFDHPDPSIFTVLTSPSAIPNLANIDFVIFPERWMVAEHTFRPPYYHRNIMSEYMGLLEGSYDAKSEHFAPGGGSLHNSMSAHGPDTQSFLKASEGGNLPVKQLKTLAFMFECKTPWCPTQWALSELKQDNYIECWQQLPKRFSL